LEGELRYDAQVLELLDIQPRTGTGAVTAGAPSNGMVRFVYADAGRGLDEASGPEPVLSVRWRVKTASVSGTRLDAWVSGYADGMESHINAGHASDAEGENASNLFDRVELEITGAPPVSGPEMTNEPRPTWTWASAGGTGVYRYQLDGMSGAWTTNPVTSYQPATGLADGSHTLYVQERQGDSSWSASGTHQVLVDTQPPEVEAGSNVLARATFRLSGQVSDALSGVATQRWRKVSGPGTVWFAAPGRAGTLCGMDADGTYVLELSAADRAGNTANDTLQVVWDTTPPLPPIVTGPATAPDGYPEWSWSSGGGGVGLYRFELNDRNLDRGGTTSAQTSHSYPMPLNPGAQTLYVQERDEAGNWSALGSHTVLVDDYPVPHLESWDVLYDEVSVVEGTALYAKRGTLKVRGSIGGDLDRLAWVEVFYNAELLGDGPDAEFFYAKLIDESFRGPVTITVRVWSDSPTPLVYERSFVFSENLVPVKIDLLDYPAGHDGYRYVPVMLNSRGKPLGGFRFEVNCEPATGVVQFAGAQEFNSSSRGGIRLLTNPNTFAQGRQMPVVGYNTSSPDQITGEHLGFFLRFLLTGDPPESCLVTLSNITAVTTAFVPSQTDGERIDYLQADPDSSVILLGEEPRGAVWLEGLPEHVERNRTYPVHVMADTTGRPLLGFSCFVDYPTNGVQIVGVEPMMPEVDLFARPDGMGLSLVATGGRSIQPPLGATDVATLWVQLPRQIGDVEGIFGVQRNRVIAGEGAHFVGVTAPDNMAAHPIVDPPSASITLDPPPAFVGSVGEVFDTTVCAQQAGLLPVLATITMHFDASRVAFDDAVLVGSFAGGSVVTQTDGVASGVVSFVVSQMENHLADPVGDEEPMLRVEWRVLTAIESPLGFDARLTAYASSLTRGVCAWDSPVEATIQIDPDGGPEVTVDRYTNDPRPWWRWSGVDGGTGTFQYQLDTLAGAWTTVTATEFRPASSLPDGSHVLYVREQLPGAVWTPVTGGRTLIDTVLPVANAGPDLASNDEFFLRGTVSDALSGVASSVWSRTSGSGSIVFDNPSSPETTCRVTLDGVHTVRLTVTDKAGNVGGDFAQIRFDTVPPSAPTVHVTVDGSGLPTWTWSSGGGGVGVYRYKLDDSDLAYASLVGTVQEYSSPYELLPGFHTLYVQERDDVGNWSSAGYATVWVSDDPYILAQWVKPAAFDPGSQVQVSLVVTNVGQEDARSVNVAIDAFPPSMLHVQSVVPTPSGPGQTWNWGRISVAAAQSIVWTLDVDPSASGVIVVPGSITYTDKDGGSFPVVDATLVVEFGTAPRPVIAGLSVVRDAHGNMTHVRLEWDGQSGYTYSVDYTESLLPGQVDWQPTNCTDINGIDGPMSCECDVQGLDRMMLRLRMESN